MCILYVNLSIAKDNWILHVKNKNLVYKQFDVSITEVISVSLGCDGTQILASTDVPSSGIQ